MNKFAFWKWFLNKIMALTVLMCYLRFAKQRLCSIREVEVIVSVVIVLSLSKERSKSVESEWNESDSSPNANTVVNNNSLDDVLSEASVHEMEEPLLSSVGSMMPDISPSVT